MAVRVISVPAAAFAGDAEAVPLPPLVTEMVNSAGASLVIVIDSSFVLLPALLVALTVNLAVPSAVGVPLISPVSSFRLRPAGRPPSMLHVIGAVPVAVRVWLYASPTYVAEHGEPNAPEDLQQHRALRLLGRTGEPIGWTLLRGSDRWEGTPPGSITANAPELLIRFARAGAGIAAVPDYFATPYLRRCELQRVMPDWRLPSITAWAVFPGRRLMPAKTRAFLDMLQAALGD